jgi:NAD(P)-dependent dehydrogenase (short-subunit alcohol dehydrogenase family)
MYKRKHTLVTGASSFIGGSLVKRRVAEGCRIRASYHTRRP